MHRILSCRVNYSDHLFLACKDDLFFPQEQVRNSQYYPLTIEAREIFEQFVSSNSLVLKKSRVEADSWVTSSIDQANESADSLIRCVHCAHLRAILISGNFRFQRPSKKGETKGMLLTFFRNCWSFMINEAG